MFREQWVGRRIVVRRVAGRDPGGRITFSDVLGDLVALDAETATIQTRSGLVEVPRSHVAAARAVEPSTADVLALEAVAARGWRAAEEDRLGGWLLRANCGFTHRASSVLPLGQPGMPLDEAIDACRDWYAERGQPLRFMVPLQARALLDSALSDRGFVGDVEVHVLAARLDRVLAGQPVSSAELSPEPDADWLANYHFRGGELPPAARETLLRHDQVQFASIRRDGRTVAIGRGSVDDGWLGLFAVEVGPDHRRQGLGTQIVTALARWAAGVPGATRSYLQVEVGNTAALALYSRLGFWQHHVYRHRGPGT